MENKIEDEFEKFWEDLKVLVLGTLLHSDNLSVFWCVFVSL